MVLRSGGGSEPRRPSHILRLDLHNDVQRQGDHKVGQKEKGYKVLVFRDGRGALTGWRND